MPQHLRAILVPLLESARDLAPIVIVTALFQILVIRRPLPGLGEILGGAALLLIGLCLFGRGLTLSLFPLGEGLARALAGRGSLPLLAAFAFALGFASTFAEPALGAVIATAADAARGEGLLGAGPGAARRFSAALRLLISGAAGLGVAVGVIRLVKGWPAAWFVLSGYGVAAALAFAAPPSVSALAFDAGATATSAINIPLIISLGIGLSGSLRGRSPLADGFGLVALTSLAPMLAVLCGGLVIG